jgi:hypothetical protein
MRTLSPATKILLVVATALGVVAALGMPWYGPAGGHARIDVNDLTRTGELQGPATGFAEGVQRWVTADGQSAATALGGLEPVLMALAGLAVLAALATLLPAVEGAARSFLQLLALAIVAIAVYKLLAQPGNDELIEPRRGAWLTLVCGAFMLSAAAGIAHAKRRRAPAQTMTALHDPTLVRPGSVAPPGR